MKMHLTHSFNCILIGKSYKSKASVSICLFIMHQHSIFNLEIWKIKLLKSYDIIYITSPNLAKYPFTSSRVVVVESPPTKIFFVLVTICKENKIITIEILKYFKWVHRLNNKTFKTLLEMKINLTLLTFGVDSFGKATFGSIFFPSKLWIPNCITFSTASLSANVTKPNPLKWEMTGVRCLKNKIKFHHPTWSV